MVRTGAGRGPTPAGRTGVVGLDVQPRELDVAAGDVVEVGPALRPPEVEAVGPDDAGVGHAQVELPRDQRRSAVAAGGEVDHHAHEAQARVFIQLLRFGVLHTDPHPGNVFLTDQGRIALLDLGMVGHTAPHMQETLLKLLLAVSNGESDVVADLVIRASERTNAFNAPEFRRKISQVIAQTRDKGLAQIKVGQSILEIVRSSADNGLFVPSELTLLGKTLLQLLQVLDEPAYEPPLRREPPDGRPVALDMVTIPAGRLRKRISALARNRAVSARPTSR